MTDEDPIALIQAAALIIRQEGNGYIETQAQISAIVRDTWEAAAIAERLMAELNTDTVH